MNDGVCVCAIRAASLKDIEFLRFMYIRFFYVLKFDE